MRIAGFGFRKGASFDSLLAVLQLVEKAGGAATGIATAQRKASSPAILRLAVERGLPVLAVPVEGIETPTRSDRVQQMFGTGSVAEAAALAGAGPNSTLIVGRMTSPDGMATCAMATDKGTFE